VAVASNVAVVALGSAAQGPSGTQRHLWVGHIGPGSLPHCRAAQAGTRRRRSRLVMPYFRCTGCGVGHESAVALGAGDCPYCGGDVVHDLRRQAPAGPWVGPAPMPQRGRWRTWLERIRRRRASGSNGKTPHVARHAPSAASTPAARKGEAGPALVATRRRALAGRVFSLTNPKGGFHALLVHPRRAKVRFAFSTRSQRSSRGVPGSDRAERRSVRHLPGRTAADRIMQRR
jgi:hypothetical protein